MTVLTLSYVAEITSGTLIGQPAPFKGVAVDSREVKPGHLFVALSGAKVDGHDYVETAIKCGAVGAMVSRPGRYNCPVVFVTDTRKALAELAASYLKHSSAKVVAITGSVGKTSCKEMTAAAIQSQMSVFKSPGNLNTEIGLPISVLSHSGEDVLVLEMAMRGLGQIAELTEIAPPDIAVITNIGESHLELLGSRDNIAKAKGEILSGMKNGGTAILNRDDDYYEYLCTLTQGPVLSFGTHEQADLVIEKPHLIDTGRYAFTLRTVAEEFYVESPWPGRHNIYNATAAIAAASAVGVDINKAVDSLRTCGAGDKRLSICTVGKNITLIDDTYNASPASMIAALETMAEMSTVGRRIGVLGSMFELGERSSAGHAEVGMVAAKHCDLVITVGEEARGIASVVSAAGRPVRVCNSPTDALKAIQELLQPNDLVLIKGSRGLKMEQIVVALREGVV